MPDFTPVTHRIDRQKLTVAPDSGEQAFRVYSTDDVMTGHAHRMSVADSPLLERLNFLTQKSQRYAEGGRENQTATYVATFGRLHGPFLSVD